ncbi:MAG TPA: C40 family peptidase [Rectinemataceae bacterium]|nr:C40 family peptidase [Rectinemataceae bacterium]
MRSREKRAPSLAGARRALSLLLFLSGLGLAAQAPLEVAAPKAARARVVADAFGFEGTPYLYGGTERSGMDCSGLVFRSYRMAIGLSVPRTVQELYEFCEPIPEDKLQPGDLVFFNTTGPIAHVGIYVGEGLFINAASEGNPTGVIESSLSDPYWRRAYAGAGRLIPPAEYLGILVSAGLGPSLGATSLARGVSGSLLVAYPLFGMEPGLELRPEYDGILGVTRITADISLGFGKKFRVFMGPALTLGDPVLDVDGVSRHYVAGGGFAATMGAVWTPISFRAAGEEWGVYAEFVLEGYGARADEPRNSYADMAAGMRAGVGIRLRLGF